MNPRLEQNEVLTVTSIRVDDRLDNVDLPTLQRRFSDLFDSAARAVRAMGLDLDDVVVDRALTCQVAGGDEQTVPAEWLSDRRRFIESVTQTVSQRVDLPVAPSLIRIRALSATVRQS